MLMPGIVLRSHRPILCRGGGVEVHINSHRGHAQGYTVGQHEGTGGMREANTVVYWGGGGIAGLQGQRRAEPLFLSAQRVGGGW